MSFLSVQILLLLSVDKKSFGACQELPQRKETVCGQWNQTAENNHFFARF